MKKLLLTTTILIFSQLAFSQGKYYTIDQIRDTLTKYENPFWAFHKLDLYKIPIGKFKQDSFLMSKAYDLLDKKYSLLLSFQMHRNRIKQIIKKYDSTKKRYLKKFLTKAKGYKEKEANKMIDSIFKDENLLKIYLDSAMAYQFRLDSLWILNKKDWITDTRYIYFHSRLMTQRSYDTIRAYYDRYYRNSTDFNNPVLIALVNMGDPEVRAKYDSIFEAKYNLNKFLWDDILTLTKFTDDYSYFKLAKLLDKTYSIYPTSSGKPYVLNRYIAGSYFPSVDTLSHEEEWAIFMDYIGIGPFEQRDGRIYVSLKKPMEEIKKYFLEYAEYERRKRQPLYDQIKYKTSN